MHERIAVGLVAQKRDQVANGSEPDTHDHWVASTVYKFVYRSPIESLRGRSSDLDVTIIQESPAETGWCRPWISFELAHRKGRSSRVSHRVNQGAYEAIVRSLFDVVVTQQTGGLGDELLAHNPGHAADDRAACGKPVVTRWCVALPTAPHHGVAMPHQKAVAGILRMAALRRAIQSRHDRLVAAVGHVVDQTAVAEPWLNRLQNAEVALILHQAACTARRLV